MLKGMPFSLVDVKSDKRSRQERCIHNEAASMTPRQDLNHDST